MIIKASCQNQRCDGPVPIMSATKAREAARKGRRHVHEPVQQKLHNKLLTRCKTCKVNLQFPSTAARSNRPFCDFALGPPVLLWTNSVHIVKLWQQSRRAQKPNIVDIVVGKRLLGRSVLGFLLPGETCFVLGLSSTSQLKSLRQEPTGRGRAPGGARRRKYAQFFASVVLASLWRKGVVTEGKCQGSQKHQA